MLLTLSEQYSDSFDLVAPENAAVIADLSLSEAALAAYPEFSPALFAWLSERLPGVWQHVAQELPDNPWITLWREQGRHINLSVIVVTNPEMHDLNRQYREKDSPTDVLTFTLGDDALAESGMATLPEIHLGEVYLSLDWAKDAVCKEYEATSPSKVNLDQDLSLYILERMIHGLLHLLGVHHDTMSAYNKVVAIQQSVIHAVT